MMLKIVNRGMASEDNVLCESHGVLRLHSRLAALAPCPGVFVAMPGVHPRLLLHDYSQEPA